MGHRRRRFGHRMGIEERRRVGVGHSSCVCTGKIMSSTSFGRAAAREGKISKRKVLV